MCINYVIPITLCVDLSLVFFNRILPLLWDYHNENGESILYLQ